MSERFSDMLEEHLGNEVRVFYEFGCARHLPSSASFE